MKLDKINLVAKCLLVAAYGWGMYMFWTVTSKMEEEPRNVLVLGFVVMSAAPCSWDNYPIFKREA